MTPARITDVATLREWLTDGGELALLDAREEGVFFRRHLFHAVCLPLSRLELLLDRLVPRRNTRVVWCDDGRVGLAERAALRSHELGWSDVSVLDGGTAAWAASGGELYAGVNVPSKAFGEFIEHTYGTPRIPAPELAALLDTQGRAGVPKVVVLDSRPRAEFLRMSIPTGIDCPGAELVHRVKEVVTDPDTLVVVNCAGRTRSIIGAQSLINAGLENRVVALENGTMGWHLAGLDVATGAEAHAPGPSSTTEVWALRAAAAVRARFDVGTIDDAVLSVWLADKTRTTYVLDVRSPEEFRAGHRPGSRSSPGGQLVQATDEYVGTRNSRLVLVDDNGVRASMTASWLRQMGWADAVVLADGLNGCALEHDDVREIPLGLRAGVVDEIEAHDLRALLARRPDGHRPTIGAGSGAWPVVVLDLATSLQYRGGHIPGSWWAVRSRMDDAVATARPLSVAIDRSEAGLVGAGRRPSSDGPSSVGRTGEPTTVVVTSEDGVLAAVAAPDVAAAWPDATVYVLRGGTRAWAESGELETGLNAPTTTTDDVWYKPYDHDDGVPEQHMQEYLTWEVALVEQLARDPTVSFSTW